MPIRSERMLIVRQPGRLHEPAVSLSLLVCSMRCIRKSVGSLDFDATEEPGHAELDGRILRGYYRHYCFLPLYVFCGHQLLSARDLRPSNIDGAILQVDGTLIEAWAID